MRIETDDVKGEIVITLKDFNYDTYDNTVGLEIISDKDKIYKSVRIVSKKSNIKLSCGKSAITSRLPLTITGSLTLLSEYSSTIIAYGDLTFEDADVNVTSNRETCIEGKFGDLIIRNSSLFITGYSVLPIKDFDHMILEETEIIKPSGITFDSDKGFTDFSLLRGGDAVIFIPKLNILPKIIGSYACTLPNGDKPSLIISDNGSICYTLNEKSYKFVFDTDVQRVVKTPCGYMFSLNNGRDNMTFAILMDGEGVEAIIPDGGAPLFPTILGQESVKSFISLENIKYNGAAIKPFISDQIAMLLTEDEQGDLHIDLYGDEFEKFSYFDLFDVDNGKKVYFHAHGYVTIDAQSKNIAINTSSKVKELILDVPSENDYFIITGGNGAGCAIDARDTNLTIMGNGRLTVNTKADYAITCYDKFTIMDKAIVDLTGSNGHLSGMTIDDIQVSGLYEWVVENTKHVTLKRIPDSDCIYAGEGSVLIGIDTENNTYKELNTSYYETKTSETLLVAAVVPTGYIFKGWSDGVKDALREVTLTPGAGKPFIKPLYDRTNQDGEVPDFDLYCSADPMEGGQMNMSTELGKVYPFYSWYPYGTKFYVEAKSNDDYTFSTWNNMDATPQASFTLSEEGCSRMIAYFVPTRLMKNIPNLAGTYYGYSEYVDYETGKPVRKDMQLTVLHNLKAEYTAVSSDPSQNESVAYDFSKITYIKEASYGYQIAVLYAPNTSDMFSFVVVNDNGDACVFNRYRELLLPNKYKKFNSLNSYSNVNANLSSNYIYFWDEEDTYDWEFNCKEISTLTPPTEGTKNTHLRYVGTNTISASGAEDGILVDPNTKNLYIELPGFDDTLLIDGFSQKGINAENANLIFEGNGIVQIAEPTADAAIHTLNGVTINDNLLLTLTAKSAFTGINSDEVEIVHQPAMWDIVTESDYETYTLVRSDREDAIISAPAPAATQPGVSKFMKDGKIVISRNGNLYNTSGVLIK